jgi:hypothetical protein
MKPVPNTPGQPLRDRPKKKDVINEAGDRGLGEVTYVLSMIYVM